MRRRKAARQFRRFWHFTSAWFDFSSCAPCCGRQHLFTAPTWHRWLGAGPTAFVGGCTEGTNTLRDTAKLFRTGLGPPGIAENRFPRQHGPKWAEATSRSARETLLSPEDPDGFHTVLSTIEPASTWAAGLHGCILGFWLRINTGRFWWHPSPVELSRPAMPWLKRRLLCTRVILTLT